MGKGNSMIKPYQEAASFRELRKLLKEEDVALVPLHKRRCTFYYTEMHPCSCGAQKKYEKAKKLINPKWKPVEV